MSHMAAIDLQITDLNALKEACQHLGLVFVENQKNWRWFGQWVDDYHAKEAAYNFGIKPEEYGSCAEHVIKVKDNFDAYEIGVVRRRDGQPGYMLVYDFYGGGAFITDIIQGVGQDGKFDRAGKLKQYYAVCVAKQSATAKGFDCRIIKKENNHLQCVGRRLKH